MKIGDLAAKYNITTQAIRYYINMGLIVPCSKEKQYIFNKQDIEDLELILRLKNLGFSLSEIHQVLSQKRILGIEDEKDSEQYRALLATHLMHLNEEKQILQGVIDSISQELQSVSPETSYIASSTPKGISLRFLPYIHCPFCNAPPDIHDMNITNQSITSGQIHCSCGYQATIRDGIIYVHGDVPINHEVIDAERRFYTESSPQMVSLYKKGNNWLVNQLNQIKGKNQVIMEPLNNTCCFLFPNIKELDPNNLYIFTDKHPEVVEQYKKAFETLVPDADILYIADPTYHYPIKHGSVTCYIDYAADAEYLTYEPQGHFFDFVEPYLAPDANIIGGIFYFPYGSRTQRQFLKQFPNAQKQTMQLKPLQDYMKTKPVRLINEEYVGAVTDSGGNNMAFSFHQQEDPLSFYTFYYKYLGEFKK